ncbi:MAG TPA: hypothetical protein VFB27_04730 [Opitutaceae bacterium]|nr:hypothetical protein [Opitutaceae bacterium]
MSLADENAKKEVQEHAEAARLADREQEAQLDRFIAENAQLLERYGAMSKAELVRGMMVEEMKREESRAAVRSTRVLAQWVTENPDVVAKVEARFENKAAETCERAFIKIAKKVAVNQTMQPKGISP